jgi:hypothetical protein
MGRERLWKAEGWTIEAEAKGVESVDLGGTRSSRDFLKGLYGQSTPSPDSSSSSLEV